MPKFFYPFIYDVPGERRGFLPLGMKIRDYYLRWVATEDFKHVENAIPVISIFVGMGWKKIFGAREIDVDILDPVAYKIILKFIAKVIPTEHSFAFWLRTLVRRCLIRGAYKSLVPEAGDKSVRPFNYHPFMSPGDIENNIFISEMKDLLLDHIEHKIRLDVDKRLACRYLAEALMEEKMPSPLVLKTKFGIPYREQQFYVDITTVIVRSELYKLRESLPHLYTNERMPFVMVFEDDEVEPEEAWDTEDDTAICDI